MALLPGLTPWRLGRRRLTWLFPTFTLMMASFFPSETLPVGDTQHPVQASDKSASRVLLSGPQDDVVPDCIPAAIDSFPGDFFTQAERIRGGVVIHFLLIAYLCAMLAVVCDEYFVPSLEIISEYLKVPSDVAGATFMAIGTSAPELFSSVVGVFITEGDIGIGTIVGSAVFNLLGICSLAGLAVCNQDVPVDWYPITRDCVMYAVTVAALVAVINNNIVTWWEALILLVLYLIYIIFMYYNAKVEGFSTLQAQKLKARWNKFTGRRKSGIPNERTPLLDSTHITTTEQDPKQCDVYLSSDEITENRPRKDSKAMAARKSSEEEEDEDEVGLCSMPYGSAGAQIWWVLMWPATLLFFCTIPDCKKPSSRKWTAITFIMSVAWIGVLSYIGVWMVTIIGYTLGIPDTVSGITILAAGTSVPEIISSIIVVRSGLGNMAVCNCIGSNIFDILFCLGAPWLIKTLAFSDTGTLVINSSAMTYTTIILLSNIVLLLTVFCIAGWKLNWKLGITLLILYFIFIVLACLYELNFFGEFNPPPCPRTL